MPSKPLNGPACPYPSPPTPHNANTMWNLQPNYATKNTIYMAMACHFLDAEQALDNTIKALQWTALTLPLHPTSHNNNSLWNPQPPDVDAPTEWYNQCLIPREDAQDSFFETPYLPTMSTPDANTIITLSTLNPQAQNSFITPNNHHSIHLHLNTSSTMTNTGKNSVYHTINHMRMSTIKHPVE